MYSEIYPDGNIPELATRHYCIYLKDKSEQLVYSAVEAIEDLEKNRNWTKRCNRSN